jgi:hypothetical protein
MRSVAILLAFMIIFPAARSASGGEADVVAATVDKTGDRVYRFDVTVRHADSGWDHYADAWDVVGTDGTVYGTRELLHPHVAEQPFTRSLSGVRVPAGIARVSIRARDRVHGYGGEQVEVTLPE